ncbi:MAG: GNAT family N-acetyltransferase [Actinomycetes bacterium]
MSDVVFSSRTDNVDWAALKSVLVDDHFDNGRTPEEYRRSHENSHAVVFGYLDGEIVANGRILSDGVCNAYLVDIWTATPHRRQGVASEVVRRLVATVPGQHVGLFTDDMQEFYSALAFQPQRGGMSKVVGSWLGR